MDLGLKGRVAIVTGASRGFGRAIALALAREGCELALCARGAPRLRRVTAQVKAAGAGVFWQACDVFQPDQAARFVRSAAEALGRLDILVNNVGGLHEPERALFEATTDTVWQRTFEMNVLQAVRLTRLCLPHLKKRGGVVLNIASISGLRPSGFDAHYGTAKAAVIMLSRTLAQELGQYRIRVNSLSPGSACWPGSVWDVIRKAYPKEYKELVGSMPFRRLARPEDIADVAAFLVSDRARWIHGANIQVDGGQEARGIAPRLLAELRRRR